MATLGMLLPAAPLWTLTDAQTSGSQAPPDRRVATARVLCRPSCLESLVDHYGM